MKNTTRAIGVSVAVAIVAMAPFAVLADAISPSIRDTGKRYSSEPARADYYGTGIAGRAMEAMELRFQVERALQDGEWDIAIAKAKKAAQLDPGDPGTHLFLARAMTKKLYSNKGPVDEKLLRQCVYEWTMIWHHDADQWDQLEAKNESRRLARVVKVLDQQRQAEELARMAAKEALARERAESRQLANQQDLGGADPDTDEPYSGAAPTATDSTKNTKSRRATPTAVAARPDAAAERQTSDSPTLSIRELESQQSVKKKKHFLLF